MPDQPTHTQPPLIELSQASVLRGGQLALDRVSLSIPIGRHTAILGANGCGKSTFIKLITRELYPLARDAGTAPGLAAVPPVRLFGEHLWDVARIRSRLGIVTASLHEALASLPGLGVREVVLGAFEARLAGPDPARMTAAMQAAADAALARADAADLAGRRYASLSTGQARRVLIARALVHRPQALLLDEPSSGLDLVARHRLLQTLRGVAADGVTLVLVTHHVEELLPEFGHLVLLRAGRVLAEGPRAQMLDDALLTATFGAPLAFDPDGPSCRVIADAPAPAHAAPAATTECACDA